MKRFSKILAATLALVLCVGMLSVAMAEDTTVVFIPKLSGNAFFESANVGAQDFAAKNGFKVDYQGNPRRPSPIRSPSSRTPSTAARMPCASQPLTPPA